MPSGDPVTLIQYCLKQHVEGYKLFTVADIMVLNQLLLTKITVLHHKTLNNKNFIARKKALNKALNQQKKRTIEIGTTLIQKSSGYTHIIFSSSQFDKLYDGVLQFGLVRRLLPPPPPHILS